MKRILSLLLVLVMTLSLVPMNVFAEDAEEIAFSDISGEEYYAEAVTALIEKGIINGYPDKTFRPDDTITRAEMATIVCRLIEKEEAAAEAFGKTDYDDVADDHWASGYINVASVEGIIGGDGDGKFRPEDPVLHEEAIKMIVCAFGYGEDVESEGEEWAKPYLEIADEKKISEGLKGQAGDDAVRGEVAVMSYNGILSAAADDQAPEEVKEAPKAPTASVKSGEYRKTQYVELETETEGAAIYYTLDGSDPTEESTKYKKSIKVDKTLTLKAIAVKDGVCSEIMTKKYEIEKIIYVSSGSSKTKITSAELQVNGAAVTSVNAGDVITLVTNPDYASGTVTWTVGGTEIAITDKTYTVTALDMGKTIKAQMVGTGSYEGTVSAECTVATATQVTAQDIMSDNADSSPVVLTDAENTEFLDDAGNPVTIEANSEITLSIENTEKTPEEVSEATTIVIQEIISNAAEGVTEEHLDDVTAVAVDVNLTVDETTVHPVGAVTVTLSVSQLGLPEGTDLANYTFSAAHTNKKNENEVVDGVVVTIDNIQYVRFELNGLSTIWIGNIPPRTVSFYNTEEDADNKVNSIGSVVVKFGDLTPTLQIPTPSMAGYLFCGWNYDMTRTPIISNLEVHALWIEGEKMPVDNIAVMMNEDTGDTQPAIEAGSVSIDFDQTAQVPANVVMTVEVTAPEGAVMYYTGTDAAVVAAFNNADEYLEIGEEAISFDVEVSDENSLVKANALAYYYKWIDADGNVIALHEIKVKIGNGSEFANSRSYTADVNRGVGKFEVYFVDNEDSSNNYVGYINNNLSGSVEYGYTLRNYVSFDGYRNDYNFSIYDALKLVFTPFEGEEYSSDDTITVTGEYYNGNTWNENWNGSYEIVDGKLVVIYPFDVSAMANEYAYIYISVNDIQQTIEINWDNGGYAESDTIDVACETWAEVLSALNNVTSEKEYYIRCKDASAITLTSNLTIPANVDINVYNTPSFTVASGVTLTLTDDRSHSCSSYITVNNGNFIVENGGKVTSNYIGENQGNRYYPSVRAKNITFKSGSSLIIPDDALMSMYPTYNYNEAEKGVLSFEAGSVIDNMGNLNSNNFDVVNLDGTVTSSRYAYFHNDEININGQINVNANGYGRFELYGTVNVGENGSVVVNNASNRRYTNLEIYGPFNNKGTVEIKGTATDAEIMNNGFVNYNEGTITIESGCTLTTRGTKFINTGVISGAGTIDAYIGDDYTNYDDGTEYVEVQDQDDGYWDENLNKYVYNLMEYSRYKYTHDPAETVDAILYLAEVISMGEGECSVTVDTEAFPEA